MAACGAGTGRQDRARRPSHAWAPEISGPGSQILLAELRKLGFAEGRNLVIDFREIGDNVHQAYTSANELVAAKADVIVVTGAELGLQAAAAARPSVPIVVMANNYDPIERGYIKSLSHPGGNITGLFSASRSWP